MADSLWHWKVNWQVLVEVLHVINNNGQKCFRSDRL